MGTRLRKLGHAIGSVGQKLGKGIVNTGKFIANSTERLDNWNKSLRNRAYGLGQRVGTVANFAENDYIGYYLVIFNGPSATIEGPFPDTKSLQKSALKARVMGFEIQITSDKTEAQEIVRDYDKTHSKVNSNKLELQDKSVTYGPGGDPIHQTQINFSEKLDEEGFPIPEQFENLMTETMINGPKQWYVICNGISKGPFTEGVANNLYKELLANDRNMMVRLVHKV